MNLFRQRAEAEFDIKLPVASEMDAAIASWENAYHGTPSWVTPDNKLCTINFAQVVATETARLTTLDIDVTVDGSARAVWLQEQVNAFKPRTREAMEWACALGTIALKPNGSGVDVLVPDDFSITATDGNKNVIGAIFRDRHIDGDIIYTRLEYHRFIDEVYHISNRAYKARVGDQDIGRRCPLGAVADWAGLMEDAAIEGIEKPLFAILKTPMVNNLVPETPLGVSVFSSAMTELRDLDVAYTRFTQEIEDSRSIALVDDRLLCTDGSKRGAGRAVQLPSYVINVFGASEDEFFQEIERPLHTEDRVQGINRLLGLISFKSGFSNGYYSFDEKHGLVTATQVESDDRRTISTIKDMRDCLQTALDDLLYAMSQYADLYSLAPVGAYEVAYAFQDITYSFEEDRTFHYNLASSGHYPWYMFYMNYMGCTEEEARQIVAEAAAENQEPGLFSGTSHA